MALNMQRKWNKKNVNLKLLTARIGDFFKEHRFEAIKGKTPTGYQILAEDSPTFKLLGYVSVTIEGNPDSFVVKLELCERKKRSRLSPFLLNMFGGGYFFLQELKSDDAWMKLEKVFWQHVENVILHLPNTVK